VTLGRQLAIAISATFFLALAGVQVILVRSAQAHLQQSLEALAQDAATSIGLSLGVLMKDTDPALVATVVNPAFDRGHYQRIEYFSAGGELLVSKTLPAQEGRYPGWFVELFPLNAPTAQSLVSAGWRQLGRIRSQCRYRHRHLPYQPDPCRQLALGGRLLDRSHRLAL